MRTISFTAVALALAGAPAAAEHLSFAAGSFTALNGSGVSGKVSMRYDAIQDELLVRLRATGLTPSLAHPAHIHGEPTIPGFDAMTPTLAVDEDGDGFIDLAEGADTYGGIQLSFTDDTASGFPEADANGVLSYTMVFEGIMAMGGADMSSVFAFAPPGPGETYANPMMDLAEVVLHGIFLPEGMAGANPLGRNPFGEANGTPGYNIALPIASAELVMTDSLVPVPVPAAGLMLLAGLGGLGFVRRRRG